jgi:hypothetical protein
MHWQLLPTIEKPWHVAVAAGNHLQPQATVGNQWQPPAITGKLANRDFSPFFRLSKSISSLQKLDHPTKQVLKKQGFREHQT